MIYTEWDQLQEIIVGRTYGTDCLDQFDDTQFVEGMSKILTETEEDFAKLSLLFEQNNVKVHRPEYPKLHKENTRNWSSEFPYPPICPRDFHIVYDDLIINTSGGDCNRYTEHEYFLDIMNDKFSQGRNYIAMPKPILKSEYQKYKSLEGQILFHSACVLKCGDTLLHTRPYDDEVYGRGTKAGLQWLKKNIPDVKWIEIPAVGHADGKLALIKPGLLMCWNKKYIPDELSHWDVIQVDHKPLPKYFNDLKSEHFYKKTVSDWLDHWIGYVDETIFDINVVSINDKTIISNGYDKEVSRALAMHGVEMIPFDFRHKYFWDSGLHCVTLDLTRQGTKENYV